MAEMELQSKVGQYSAVPVNVGSMAETPFHPTANLLMGVPEFSLVDHIQLERFGRNKRHRQT